MPSRTCRKCALSARSDGSALLSGKQTRSWGVWGGFYLYAGQPQQRDRAAVAGYLDDTELLPETHVELTDPALPGHMTPATAA